MSHSVDGKSSYKRQPMPVFTRKQIKTFACQERRHQFVHSLVWTLLIVLCLYALVSFLTC